MMDTTWTVLRLYVTALLIAVSRTGAVALAFAFGRIESAELYELFWTLFHEELHIELSEYILESDQGSGRWKFARLRLFTHRFCMGHFLASLKDGICPVYVHYLVETRTEHEFGVLCESYRPILHTAMRSISNDGLGRVRTELGKAGLDIVYAEGDPLPCITIKNPTCWAQVS
jgi:hypothetical protein